MGTNAGFSNDAVSFLSGRLSTRCHRVVDSAAVRFNWSSDRFRCSTSPSDISSFCRYVCVFVLLLSPAGSLNTIV